MKDFKLTPSSLGYLVSEVTKLITGNPNKAYRVSICEWRERRSISQNSIYWKWLTEISNQAVVNGERFKPDIWHEYLKKYFCPVTVVNMPAGEPSKVKSTKMLDTGEMHHYLNKIERWAMDRMFVLTIPDQCEYKALQDRQEE